MKNATRGHKVTVAYKGFLDDGTIVGKANAEKPLVFVLGLGKFPLGFEQALEGMKPGEMKTVLVAPDKAYGRRDPSKIIKVRRKEISAQIELKTGLMLKVINSNQQTLDVTVRQISEDIVLLDSNHPLAGLELNFEICLLKIN